MSSKLLMKYTKNYLSCLVILLILLAPIYLSIYTETKERILIEKSNQLRSGVDELDSQISKMQFVRDMLRSNEEIARIVKIKKEPQAKDSLALNNAKEFMADCLLLGNSDIQEREFLIFRDNNIVLTNDEILSHSVYHNYLHLLPGDMKYEEFRECVFEDAQIIQYIPYSIEPQKGILCVMKGPSNRLNAFDMALVFWMNESVLNRILGIGDDSQMNFAYITDTDGEILFQVNYDGEPLVISEQDMKLTLNGQQYSVIHMNADICGLSWTVGISSMTINKEITNVNRIIWIYIIMSVVIMIMICTFWALRRTHLMTKIYDKLKLESEADIVIGNEYKYLTTGVERLKCENELYKERVEELSKSISYSMLEKLLLSGIYSNKEREEVLRYLEWDMEYYCIVCLNVEDIEQDEQLLEYFYKIDIVFYENFKYISMNTARCERVYIIKMNENDLPNTNMVSEQLYGLLSIFSKVKAGVSTIGTGVENVQVCYRQAKLMVRQVADTSNIKVKQYQESYNGKSKFNRLNLGNQIYDLIYAKEKNDLDKVFDKIRVYAIKKVWKTEQEVMRFFFEIQSPIFRAWDEINITESEQDLPIYRSDRPIHELVNDLQEAACYLCDSIRKSEESNKAALGNEMRSFAESNYFKKEMCLGYAADHFDISEKRFSALFKELIGENFSFYIENKRLQQAEKYLCETDWSMNKIADAIGYNSLDSFYKSFKKRYGLAPGKWKERKLVSDKIEE